MNDQNNLNFSDIAGYLPYTVPFILNQTGIFNLDSEFGTPYEATQPMFLTNLIVDKSGKVEIEIESPKTKWGIGMIGLDEVQVVLKRPQDLTKEEYIKIGYVVLDLMTVTDKKNVFALREGRSFVFGVMAPCFEIKNYPRLQKVLNEVHFDYAGLIDRGLAVSINDKIFKS